MVFDVACGSESVSVVTTYTLTERLIVLLYKEGTESNSNETYPISPDLLELSIDKNECPFVSFSLFEDKDFTVPWTNTSLIDLVNQDDP